MVRHDRSLHKQFRWSHDFHLVGKILLIITNGQWHSGVRYQAMGQVVIEDTGNYYGYDLQDRKMESSRR